MQERGPIPKDNEVLGKSSVSIRSLVGINSFGFSKYFGSRFIPFIEI